MNAKEHTQSHIQIGRDLMEIKIKIVRLETVAALAAGGGAIAGSLVGKLF